MPDIRTLTLASAGDPSAQLNVSGRQAQQVGASTPSQNFARALFEMLTRAQETGIKEQERLTLGGIEAGQAQTQRILQKTPQELIGASPDIQAGVRGAQARELQPTISAFESGAKTVSGQLSQFTSAVEAARAFGSDIERQEQQRKQDALNVLNMALGAGSKSVEDLLITEEGKNLLRIAGIKPELIQSILPGLKIKEERATSKEKLELQRLQAEIDKLKKTGAQTGTTGATYQTRLREEINKVYSGRYGREGARERALDILKKEFPSLDPGKDIYNRIPDGYEQNIGRQTASTLNQETMSSLLEDVRSGATLQELYRSYPEVSPSLIQSLYYNQ